MLTNTYFGFHSYPHVKPENIKNLYTCYMYDTYSMFESSLESDKGRFKIQDRLSVVGYI